MFKYIAQHPKRKMIEVFANSSYDAAKVAATNWGLRSTAGISVTYLGKVREEKAIDPCTLGN
jgi:hypothetical protein